MINCNPCENEKCGSCVADKLVGMGFIKDAGDHCGCAERGHKNEEKVIDRPKVKSMFTKTKKEEDEPVAENRIITEEEIEVD